MLIFVVVIVLGRKISGRSLQGGRPFFGLKFDSLAWFYFFKSKGIELGKPPFLQWRRRFFVACLKNSYIDFQAVAKDLKKR